MFEKEAEEYAIGLTYPKFQDSQIANVVLRDVEGAYQQGAEFGYNLAKEEIDYLNKHWRSEEERKANEWHFVKDGDLPKNNTYCLVVKEYEGATGKYTRCKLSTYKDNSFLIWNHEYDSYVQLHNVIAWKEIVLPKLISKERLDKLH